MAQPFSYMLNVPNPAEAVTGGLQQGVQLASMMERADLMAAQRRQTDIENRGLLAKQARATEFQQKLGELSSEGFSARGLNELMIKYPEASEQLKAQYANLSTQEKQSRIDTLSPIVAAVNAGDNASAQIEIQRTIDAFKNSGKTQEADAAQRMSELLFQNPAAARTIMNTSIAAAMGPDKYAEVFGKLEDQRREQEVQPFKVQEQAGKAREQAGKAEEAEVRGRFAEKTVKSEIGQRNAAASASYASAENSRANAKRALAQAKTEDETRDAKRSLLEANANVARAKWQKTMGNPEDARQGAVHGIAVIDKLLDPKRKDDIQQIFGQIGTSAKGEFKMGALRPDWSLSDSQMSILADVEQLGGRTFLDQAQKMRGLGQLTEQEGKKIVAAAGNLTRNQSPDRFTETLKAMRDVLAAGAKRKPGEVPAGSLDIGDGGGGEAQSSMQTGPITLPSGFKYTFEGE
jgi:hypothetical protein